MSTPFRPGKRPSFPRRFFWYWSPLLALCAAIFWQSCFPSVIKENMFEFQDKCLHFSAYALMAFLAARAMDREQSGLSQGFLFTAAAVFCIVFGLSDEFHQSFVPGRTASVWDWVADTVGSLAGAAVFLAYRLKYRQIQRKQAK